MTTPHSATGESSAEGSPAVRPATPHAAHAVFGDRVGLAERFVEELATSGVTHGLIGPREVPRLWDRHVLNCAVLEELVPRGAAVIDVGSGAGLPGLAIAIARPDLQVHLVEPMLRRTTWLQGVVERLGLEGVQVTRARAEQVAGTLSAPVVTARAVARMGQLTVWCAPLLDAGGMMLALKGSSAEDEIAEDRELITAAGVQDVEVAQCGAGVLEIPTTVVRAFVGADHVPGPTPLLTQPRQEKRRSGPGTRTVSRETSSRSRHGRSAQRGRRD